MNLDDILGDPVVFGEFVRDPKRLPAWAWLYTAESGPVTFSTLCRSTLVDSRELSEAECDLRDEALVQRGFRCVVSRSQIEDITSNLRYRFPNPTDGQIQEAVRFYLAHDAFIVT